ncbi:acetate--CoA ligase family protein [soil metagenome]
MNSSTTHLECFTAPRSIAVIGASTDPTRIGGRPLRYLLESGFEGAIYPINARNEMVQGLRAYRSMAEVPAPVDCALILVPSSSVIESVRQCAAIGVKGVVIFSSGFAEVGEQGEQRQAEVMAIARSAGMRVIGPNCLGLFCTRSHAYLTFSGVFEDVVGKPGDLGLISQSGGFAGEFVKLAVQRGLRFSTWMTTGNEADVELGEVLMHMAQDPDTRVIGLYLEGARKRESFLQGLDLARRNGKRVVALKAGRTAAGAAAVQSHTAGLAGSDRLYDVILARYGVHRARSIEEMLDIIYTARQPVRMPGKRLAILSTSGGNGALAADFAIDSGFSLPALPDEVQQQIKGLAEDASTSNPVDLTAKVASDPSVLAKTLEAMLGANAYDGIYVFVGLVAGIQSLIEPLLEVMRPIPARYPGVPIVLSITAPDAVVRRYEEAGYILIQDPARAITALRGLAGFDAHRAEDVLTSAPAREAAPGTLAPGRSYSEIESKALLERIGIPLLQERLMVDGVGADRIAADMGGRMALKIVSPDILHKTDVGGVRLHVPATEAPAAVMEMIETVRRARPDARIDGVLMSPMLDGALELIVGAHADPIFGPVIMVGAGGVAVEITDDIALRLAPVNASEARAMVQSLKCYRLLDGYRGRPPANVDALVEVIVALSEFAHANAQILGSIEINPLAVLPHGKGTIALDALIETTPLAPLAG